MGIIQLQRCVVIVVVVIVVTEQLIIFFFLNERPLTIYFNSKCSQKGYYTQ